MQGHNYITLKTKMNNEWVCGTETSNSNLNNISPSVLSEYGLFFTDKFGGGTLSQSDARISVAYNIVSEKHWQNALYEMYPWT